MKSSLALWGWDADWEKEEQAAHEPGLLPGRVTVKYRDQCLLQMADGERLATVSGRFRHEAQSPADFPAVGDWVLAEVAGPDLAVIPRMLPRRTVLSRKAAGTTLQEQVIAANVETVFVVTAFDLDFSARRIERYVTMGKQMGMAPVVLLNKCDLEIPNDPRWEQALQVTPEGCLHRISAKTGEGFESVKAYLPAGKTGMFLGSSGVGKSTLLNALLGDEVQKTQTVRVSDGTGRHTTTTREMFLLPDGGLLIDTPGLREVQLWADAAVLPEVFTDIDLLARDCRYADCSHDKEPQCAVQAALKTGALVPERYAAFRKLQKELAYLERKQDPVQQANTKRRWKKIHASMRDYVKEKYRRDE